MHLSADERQIYHTLWVLSLVEDLLAELFISSPEFMDPQSELPMTIEAETVGKIRDVWSSVSMARQHLIGTDKRRQLWTDAVACLRYERAEDFQELHLAIMQHATSGRWTPHFCKAVLAGLRDIARTSPPAAFAVWKRAMADRRARGNPLTAITDEPSGA